MRTGQLRTEHMKWVTLTTLAIVVFVVDATVLLDPVSREYVTYYGETAEQAWDGEKKVIYEGDQVWRVYKRNVSETALVEQYEDYGCT